MKFIKQNKWLLLATLICTAITIYLTVQELNAAGILWNGKFALPFFPLLLVGLVGTINEFIEEVKNVRSI